MEVEDKHLDSARRLLLVAYRNPAASDLTPLLAYLSATGRSRPDDANRLPGAEFSLSFANRARLLAALCQDLEKTQPAEARRLAMAHPELWSAAPAVVDSLCAAADTDKRPTLAAALEDEVAQANPPSRPLARSLEGLYAAWAETELKESGHAAEGLAHLTRAHELQPDDFAVAGRLATLYVEKKQPTRATEVLHDFLAPDAFPAERQQAQQILARK